MIEALAAQVGEASDIGSWLYRLAMEWVGFKTWLSIETGVGHSVLHVYLGLLFQIAIATFMRRGFASWLPWLAVFAVQAGNEVLDWSTASFTPSAALIRETLWDTAFTMALPTVLLVLARIFPRLGLGEQPPAAPEGSTT